MSSPQRRQQRLANLRRRLANPQDAYEQCRAYPCTNATTADRGEGLNRLYCRKHIEFYRRHGSYVKASYPAGELRPYRKRAIATLQDHQHTLDVRSAIAEVQRLYRGSGAPVEAFRLRGMPPAERAKAVWAQLRRRKVDPLEVVAVWLAIDMRLRDDPQPDRHEEYRQVQAAKLLHRIAGGTHKRWERERVNGSTEVTELHKHPVSRGRVLRVLGRQVAKVGEPLSSGRFPAEPQGD